jgi:MFS family permease
VSSTESCVSRPVVDDVPDPPRSRRRWAIFAVVAIALLMVSIDNTAVATALPAIGSDLDSPLAWTSWTITVYALGQLIAMPVCGRLCEQFGRKRMFLVAVAVFTAASAVCALSGQLPALIAARAVQGIAGGAVLPAATGLVADSFGAQRDRAVGMFTTVFPVGALVGPIVGGVLVSAAGWRSIFVVNLLPGLVLCVLGALLLREPRVVRARQDIDGWGIGLLIVLFLGAMTSSARLGVGGVLDPLGIAAAVLAVGALVLFARHVRRDPAAVIPARLIVGTLFGRMNVVNVLFGASAIGFSALVPLYAQLRYGIGPLAAGGLLTARAVGMISTAGLSVWLMRRTGQRVLIVGGFALIVVGLGLLAVPVSTSAQVWLMVAAGITGVGMGMAAPATNNAVMHLARDEVAAVSGLRGMFRQCGAIIAVSVVTAVGTASSAPAEVTAWAFVVLAVLLVCAVPLVLRVPDRREGW